MKIAIDISPLSTGHKYRGTGSYVLNLKKALEKYFSENTYYFFTQKNEIPKDADIIHLPYFDPFSFSIPFSQIKKTIVTVLDLTPIIFPREFSAGLKGNLRWQVQKLSLKSISRIITDSNSAKKDIQRLAGIKEEKINVTYLAAGEQFVQIKSINEKQKILQKKYNLPEKFALYVGDVTWNKNLPRVVEAAIQARISLVMVGKALVNENYDATNKWNSDLVKVQNLAKDHKEIIRLGFVPEDDLVALYNCATVFVMPSLYEGFGLPILEAMACGCPVITSKEGSLPEVAGNAAYFVDAKNIDSITVGLKEVFNDEKLQNELSKKGLQQVKEFSWQKTAKETIKAYEKTFFSNK